MITSKRKLLLTFFSQSYEITKIKFVKLMFLISREIGGYDFIPYKYGPFSFELYRDLNYLEVNGYIRMTEESIKPVHNGDFSPSPSEVSTCHKYISRYRSFDDKMIMDDIYHRYPFFTIFSSYRKEMEYARDEKGVATIGYEGKTIDAFLNELIQNKVNVLVDVRKNPLSRKFGFSKGKLSDYCQRIGVEYVHIPKLGIDTKFRKNLSSYEDYAELFREYEKGLSNRSEEIDRIIELSRSRKIALMCFEKDVNYCHRGVIAKRLREGKLDVTDI